MDQITQIKESQYRYSEPVLIRKWNGGEITVMVGYVKKHPEINRIVLCTSRKGFEDNKYYIRDGEDWLKIKQAVQNLLPELSDTQTSEDIDAAIKKVGQEVGLLELFARYPGLLSKIPDNINILSLPEEQKQSLNKLLSVGGEVANSIISNLAKQPITDLESFVQLLDKLKLSTINSLVTHVTSRTGFIELFEKVIRNDNSYEKRGSSSVHNLLKANIWMVDRNYSILHDDETIKNIILEQWQRETSNRDGMGLRPDFLCMVDQLAENRGSKNLVIIEIKRPSVKIDITHVNQVMGYRSLLDQHSGTSIANFSCLLIGREVDQNLQKNPLTNSGYAVKTYDDFIREARQFYQEYLKIVKEESFAF